MTLILNGTTGVSSVDGSASTPAIQGTDSNTGVFFPAADTVAIATGGTEAMRVNSSQNVGIGTSSPGARLHVAGGASQVSGSNGVAGITNGNTSGGMKLFAFTAAGTANGYFAIEGYDKEYGRFDSSGNLLVGRTNNPGGLSSSLYVTGAYSNTTPSGANVFVNTDGSFYRSTSSLKYKTNVFDYSRGLADIAKLRPVFYRAKAGLNTEQQFAGFIAEEVEAAGLTEFVQYAEDGTPDALSYGNMVALLTKAIQEQQALIESLTARIAALEAA